MIIASQRLKNPSFAELTALIEKFPSIASNIGVVETS